MLAASVPGIHSKPSFISFDDSTNKMTLQLYRSNDNGGAPITSYELYVDAGDDFTSSFTEVAGYNNQDTTYSASTSDGLVLGKIYRFKTRAENEKGYSEFSDEAYISFGDIPAKPAAPTLVASSKNSITVKWVEPSAGSLSITGYILNMDSGNNDDIEPIYIGTNRPDITEHTVGDLSTGKPYRFTINAINDNGESEESDIAQFYACDPPSYFNAPTYSSSDQTAKTITIKWTVPSEDGGCAITGYELYRNDGDDTDPSIKVTDLASNDPSTLTHVVTLSSGTVGDIYKFSLIAFNFAG